MNRDAAQTRSCNTRRRDIHYRPLLEHITRVGILIYPES